MLTTAQIFVLLAIRLGVGIFGSDVSVLIERGYVIDEGKYCPKYKLTTEGELMVEAIQQSTGESVL